MYRVSASSISIARDARTDDHFRCRRESYDTSKFLMRSNTLKSCALFGLLLIAVGCTSGQAEGDDTGLGGSVGSSAGIPDVGTAGNDELSGSGNPGGGSATGVSGGFGRAGSGGSGRGGSGNAGPGGASATGGAPPVAGAAGASGMFVGNITTGNNSGMDQGTRKFATYWDQVTPENAGKWGSVQPSVSSAFNWTALDAIYDYAEMNHIIFKQHNFIWGSQQPSGSVDPAAVQKWMTAFCTRYPNTKLIDVVNEPPPHTTPAYADAIGGGTNGDWKWIANAFTWARAACPNAVLILNDFNDIEWTNDNAHMIDIVKKIQALDAPIDAIGAQAHDLDNGSVSLATVTKLLGNLNSQTGLPVYITEMDISTTDDAQQLKLYQQYFPLFKQDALREGHHGVGLDLRPDLGQRAEQRAHPSGTPRPAMTYLMNSSDALRPSLASRRGSGAHGQRFHGELILVAAARIDDEGEPPGIGR